MKKIIIIISLVIIGFINIPTKTYAATNLKDGALCYNGDICAEGLACQQDAVNPNGTPRGHCRPLIDTLTPRPTTTNTDAKQLAKLPDVSLEGGMTLAIKAILRSAMLLTIIAIVVAAIYYIISRGKDEDVTKAKDIILYLVIGMVIIAAAYGVVAGVTQFNVFS